MPECPECGTHILSKTLRVMIPEDAELTGCPDCEGNVAGEYQFEK